MIQILGQKFIESEDIIERLGSHLVTVKDADQFVKMISNIYAAGYERAVNDNREQLEKLGYSVKVTSSADNSSKAKIFPDNQPEKSG